jgi:hypothetical protein
MAVLDGPDGSEPDAPQKKGFDLSSFLKPVAEVDSAIGKLFLFPLGRSDISAFKDISSKEQDKRIREFLPFIASLSPDYSWEKERSGVTHDQIQSLSDLEVEKLAEAYALSDEFRSAREGKDRKPIVRDANESSTAFLDRLLQSEADYIRKLNDQILGSTQGLFDQVRKSSSILGSTLTEFEQLTKCTTPRVAIRNPGMDRVNAVNEQLARHASESARERAEELETVRLTGKMTAESAKALKELVDAAATLMEQMDEREQKTDRTTSIQITIAVWAVGISAGLALLALVVSGFGYYQDQNSIISGSQWQEEMLAAIQQVAEQRSASERENQELREQVKSLESRMADLESAERKSVDTINEAVPE